MKRENNLEKKVVKISTLGDDQGGGMSWCENCNYHLDSYLNFYFSNDEKKRAKTGLFPEEDLTTFLKKNEMQCPNCGSYLEFGKSEPYPFGGSDFY